MSEETTANELTLLKDRAKQLGISFSPNIGVDALRAKVAEELEGEVEIENSPVADMNELRNKMQMLKRVTVIPTDPKLQNVPGDIFQVANDLFSIRRMIPFNRKTHIEVVLYNMLKDKKRLHHYEVTNSKGQKTTATKYVAAFNVIDEPLITQEELDAIARQQKNREVAEADNNI